MGEEAGDGAEGVVEELDGGGGGGGGAGGEEGGVGGVGGGEGGEEEEEGEEGEVHSCGGLWVGKEKEVRMREEQINCSEGFYRRSSPDAEEDGEKRKEKERVADRLTVAMGFGCDVAVAEELRCGEAMAR